jgi:hypothetical protein
MQISFVLTMNQGLNTSHTNFIGANYEPGFEHTFGSFSTVLLGQRGEDETGVPGENHRPVVRH